MKRDDSGLIVVGVGLLALWAGLTDAIYRYVRPSMRPWLIMAGGVLAVLGVVVLFTNWWERRQHPDEDTEGHDGHHHRSRVGWLLAVPLIVALAVDPGALGAYAVGRQSGFRAPTNVDFDLESHLRSHSFGGQAPELNVLQVSIAASEPEQWPVLASTPVKVEGFVVNDDERLGTFLLARVLVGCCAGDGLPLTLEIRDYHGPPMEDETWIEVVSTFDDTATEKPNDDNGGIVTPVMTFQSLHEIDPPSEQYLYPW